jgi:hypothetical protein
MSIISNPVQANGLDSIVAHFCSGNPPVVALVGTATVTGKAQGLPLQRPTLKRIHKFSPVFFAFGSVLNVGIKLYLYVKKHIFVVVLEGGTDG